VAQYYAYFFAKINQSTIFSEAKRDHSDEDCLAIVVLTHGKSDTLFAHDGEYPTKTLWNAFTADRCPTLLGKPKLFFIQVQHSFDGSKSV